MKFIRSNLFNKSGNLSYYFSQYCSNASIHGLKFLGEPKRLIVERLWWILFISVSLFFCTTHIWDTYKRWMNAPVIVSFATSATQIWEIPFPTVTICPFVKSDKKKYDWTHALELRANGTEQDMEAERKFRYMSLVCKNNLPLFDGLNLTDLVEEDAIPFLIDVGVDFNFSVHSCKWLGHDCSNQIHKFFTPMLTGAGICYSLNMLNPNEIFTEAADTSYYTRFTNNEDQPPSQWDIENGYENDNHVNSYPMRTVMSGPAGGIDLILYTPQDNIDYNCGDSTEGFRVLLHHPAEIPRASQRFFWVPLDKDVVANVQPTMMTASHELRGYSARHRKCYFTNERSLKYFKIYNQQNCILECMSNFTYRLCNCVPFNMPRDNSTPICGPSKKECVNTADYMFMVYEASFQDDRKTSTSRNRKRSSNTKCFCLQSCHSLNYDVVVSQMDWNWNRGFAIKDGYSKERAHMSRLRIFYKDLQFMTSERNELFGQTAFWANCGGLLGLFTGFSFISLVEILYFATLRLACNIVRYGRHRWSGADELSNVAH